ncbi:MAG: Histidine kinase [Vezdaea aestivalis]|nr:MAG: Histidine kinase [Vezdaea aestivalis]
MRIPIREQLGLLVLVTSLMALAVVAITTWVNNYNFVVGIRSSSLALTASLKAAQLSSNLLVMQSLVVSISTRVLIGNALLRYTQGNNTDANWINAILDLQRAMGSGPSALLLQSRVYPYNDTGLNGPEPVVNTTGGLRDETNGATIALPELHPNGTQRFLGDVDGGFPPSLYPNITYKSSGNTTKAYILDREVTPTYRLLLGPYQINSSFALISMTLPVVVNSSVILGYITITSSASLIYAVFNSLEGLDSTGEVLLIGPDSIDNRSPASVRSSRINNTVAAGLRDVNVRFVFPPVENSTRGVRHPSHNINMPNTPFPIMSYPGILDVYTKNNSKINNAGSLLRTRNEDNKKVSVGYAMPQSPFCNWALLVEQDESETLAPIRRLRNILLACVFGTTGAILLFLFPIAHYSVTPIRRLRAATKASVQPRNMTDDGSSPRSSLSRDGVGVGLDRDSSPDDTMQEKAGHSVIGNFMRWKTKKSSRLTDDGEDGERRNSFRIPSKVRDRKHFIHDELTDLTQTFNEMSEELMAQYERLEEKVRERTRELELSKKAAEAANESKTLFIANISHELKTPLNGILGMCAVLMHEDDMTRMKRSLGIVYKSGDLLLHLLNDLLTFSKNQIGKVLSLEEHEFRLSDVSSQVASIFEKQANEGKIKFRLTFQGQNDLGEAPLADAKAERGLGPPGTGRIKDMCLWGDQNRILQVIINLVSNSLKFTPPGKTVDVRIRCLGEMEELVETDEDLRRESIKSQPQSQRSSQKKGKGWGRMGSSTSRSSAVSQIPSKADSDRKSRSHTPMNTALRINPMDSKPYSQIAVQERSMTPPPTNARTLIFEFEVEDTGPGIAESQQERVFEPFMQGDLGLSKKFGGTGLGLSICSQLATLMRGNIRLRSQVGQGSVFTMRIPLKFTKLRPPSLASSLETSSRRSSIVLANLSEDTKSDIVAVEDMAASDPLLELTRESTNKGSDLDALDQPTKPRLVGLSQPFFAGGSVLDKPSQQMKAVKKLAEEASKKGDKIRVLVAEDNPINQEVVLRMLKQEDIYDVAVAKDGQEAFDAVKASMASSSPFNLVFMDIQMPNVDGIQSTRRIRELGYNAPIVALTAFAEESNVKDCMASGMNHFLAKPIRRPALKQVLKTYCSTIPEEAEANSAGNSPPSRSPEQGHRPFRGKSNGEASNKGKAPQPAGQALSNGSLPGPSTQPPASS